MFSGIMKDMQLGEPFEAFNFGANRRYRPYYDVSDFYLLISRVLEKQTSPETGVFGVKFFWDHLERFYQQASKFDGVKDLGLNVREMLEVFFGSPYYVFLRRRDILKQAVSLARAIQSNHFQTIDDVPDTLTKRRVRYDANLISQILIRIMSELLLWERFFREFRLAPHRLWYEDLVENREKSMLGVLSYLGEDAKLVPEPRTSRLSSQTNNDWYTRYREDNKWFSTFDVEQLMDSLEYGDSLARLAYYHSLEVSPRKGTWSVAITKGINFLRWRLGRYLGR
jgi:LPS sulfotransferase NodH